MSTCSVRPHGTISISCPLLSISRYVQSIPDGSSSAHSSLYSELDLSILFGDVLDIALAGQLPVLNRAKTYSLSLWALSSHRLPAAVVSSRQDDVLAVLQRCFGGARQPDSVAFDGLKVRSSVRFLFPPSHAFLPGHFAHDRTLSISISRSSFSAAASRRGNHTI